MTVFTQIDTRLSVSSCQTSFRWRTTSTRLAGRFSEDVLSLVIGYLMLRSFDSIRVLGATLALYFSLSSMASLRSPVGRGTLAVSPANSLMSERSQIRSGKSA